MNIESGAQDQSQTSASATSFLMVPRASTLSQELLQASPGSSLPAEFAAQLLAQAVAKATPSFAQEPVNHFNEKPTHLQAYAPQSGQVIGILSQMKDEFEANLSQAQKSELKAAEDYAKLKAAAEEQIASDSERLDNMELENAAASKALSDAKEDLEAARTKLSADRKFLSDLRLKCQELDHQWGERSKSRSAELTAVSETIAILTEDDARDLFHKKMGTGGAAPSFLQLARLATSERARRGQAARALLRAAKRLERQAPEAGELYSVWHAESKPHEQLATIAVSVQLDTFAKIKQVMDDMIAKLKEQQESEVKHKEYCLTELNENEKTTYTTQQALADLKDKIAALEATIEKLTEEIADAKQQIADTEVEVKKASEMRKGENAMFQEEVSDQRALQQILKKAIARMAKVYKALLQEDPTPPVHFQPYKKNAGASPVISLLEQIVGDSQKVENEAVATENEAQTAYSDFVNNADASIKSLNAAIETKTKAITAAEVELEDTKALKQSTEGQLEDLVEYAGNP